MKILPRANEIQRHRILLGMSMRELACKAGLNNSTISNIETYRHSVRPKSAKAICDALNSQFDELFEVN